jgi:hypothetical protein
VTAALAGVVAWILPGTAHAERYSVEREEEAHEHEGPRSGLNLGFDVDGAVATSMPRLPSGSTLTGGGGFKVRVGDQFRFPRLRVTPEGGYAFDHLFASDDFGHDYAWDMHRLFGGVRLGFGTVVVPGFYADVGYGWRGTTDPTVPATGGIAFTGGFALDLHVIPHLGLGGHVEYATVDAQPYGSRWIALGLHGDLVF